LNFVSESDPIISLGILEKVQMDMRMNIRCLSFFNEVEHRKMQRQIEMEIKNSEIKVFYRELPPIEIVIAAE